MIDVMSKPARCRVCLAPCSGAVALLPVQGQESVNEALHLGKVEL